MNALKSMMKATARVRRDGTEAQIPAEELVVGDVVLISAGDQVPADGRIVAASALQIDESALTGESVPAAKDAETLPGDQLGPGGHHPDQPAPVRLVPDSGPRPPGVVGTRQVRGAKTRS
jgi:P-type E1-E2 ATPase